MRLLLVAAFTAATIACSNVAYAIHVAVWVDNNNANGADTFINSTFGAGSAIRVSMANLETPGFLSAFDAFFATSSANRVGSGLTAAAAANVVSYVGTNASRGTIVLFPGDWTDMLAGPVRPDPDDPHIDKLFANAVSLATVSGHGYIGEFNGAAMAMDSNSDSLRPLHLVSGAAGPLTEFSNGVDTVSLTSVGAGQTIVSGVSFPFSPIENSTFRTAIAEAPTGDVIALWADGVPAIIVSQVPEPTTAALLLLGILSCVWHRQHRQV